MQLIPFHNLNISLHDLVPFTIYGAYTYILQRGTLLPNNVPTNCNTFFKHGFQYLMSTSEIYKE